MWHKNHQNIVLFIAHKGKMLYGGNMKFVADEIIRQKLHCKVYWYVKSSVVKRLEKERCDNYDFPEQIKVITGCFSLLKIAFQADVIATDNHLPNVLLKLFKKKKKQFILNTWHGSLGIKKIALKDIDLIKKTKEKYSKLLSCLDVMISNCDWENNVYRNDIGFTKKIIKLGHPRNDIFFLSKDENQKIKQKVHKDLGIPEDNCLILIAPTYRFEASTDEYKQTLSYDFDNIKRSVEKRFGMSCTIALRLHPELKKERVSDCFKQGIVDATSYPDIQELLVAADAMITDYSSAIFDFLFTRKPGFIFAPDRKHYEMTRGLYFPLEESPFPVAEDNETLCKNIVNFDNNLYQKRVEEFLKSRNVVDDGHASERVVELIKEHLK